ncbi:MAG: hypothetical protein M3352_04440 [Bacteroidota bacterium]|nr:hypothetical protein [Bacteroidota bacterium]
MKRFLPLLFIMLYSCDRFGSNSETGQLQGYAPIYASRQVVNTITTQSVRPTVRPGKIYAYGSYLFQVEQNEGIHIINNSNPQQASKIAFLKVPMATEIAIQSDHLYTNNLNDLVVFNLANIASPQLVNRIADAFPVIDQSYPPFTNTAFECADPSKGIVVAWERKMIDQPKCRR